MMRVNEFANRRLQLCDAAVNSSAQLFVGQLGKPALDEIQPGPVGRCEVHVEARALRQPVANQRRFMRTVVVHDQMDVELFRHRGVDRIEELSELD